MLGTGRLPELHDRLNIFTRPAEGYIALVDLRWLLDKHYQAERAARRSPNLMGALLAGSFVASMLWLHWPVSLVQVIAVAVGCALHFAYGRYSTKRAQELILGRRAGVEGSDGSES